MSVVVEDLGKNMSKMVVTIAADKLEKALNKAYNKQKGQISMPGFRKGKVPRYLIEKTYGPEVFYEDATNILVREEYPAAYDESGLDIVSQPEIDIVQIEKGKDFIFEAVVAVRPEVELGEYKGVTVTKIDVEVTDEEVDAEINKELEKNSRTISVDRAAENGDVLKIDFEGYMDGEQFENGTAEDFDLELGSHSFVGTFEEQLIGAKKGEDVEVNVTFPEEYQAKELAGKDAMFKVHVKDVKATELPKLDDEFVQDVDADCDTVDDYKKKIKENLTKSKETEATRAKEDEAVAKIVDDSKMDVPEPMIEGQIQQMMQEFSQRLAMQGMSFEQYMQFSGMNEEKFKEQAKPEALKRISTSLVLEKIADVEKIEVSEEEVEEKMKEISASYGMEFEEFKKIIPETEKENIKKDVAIGKAVDLVMENAKEKKATKKKTTAKKDTEKKDTEKKTTAKKTTTKKAATKKDTEKKETAKKTTAKKTTTKKTTTKKTTAKKETKKED
ncbi:MAG: trigger factor [Lachnospiraceae bacterium]|nr:trigger factor [Lachnospiraceae bacterium]